MRPAGMPPVLPPAQRRRAGLSPLWISRRPPLSGLQRRCRSGPGRMPWLRPITLSSLWRSRGGERHSLPHLWHRIGTLLPALWRRIDARVNPLPRLWSRFQPPLPGLQRPPQAWPGPLQRLWPAPVPGMWRARRRGGHRLRILWGGIGSLLSGVWGRGQGQRPGLLQLWRGL